MELEKDQLDVQLGTETNTKNIYIEVTADGPYLLHGQTKMVQHLRLKMKHIYVDVVCLRINPTVITHT